MNSAKIKRIFTHDWEAKLICLVLAMLLWWVVRDQIERSTMSLKPELPDGWPFQTVPAAPARPEFSLPRPPTAAEQR